MGLYILEIPEEKIRQDAILFITSHILHTDFISMDDACSDERFFYLDHSTHTKTQRISIHDTRELKRAFTTKHTSETRLIIINNAHQLTTEAQNSLLKDLEEAGDHTIILLGVAERKQLLETVLSRGVQIEPQTIAVLHESLRVDKEKFMNLVYNRDASRSLDYVKDFLKLSPGDAFTYIQDLDKQNKGKNKEKNNIFESFLQDLLSYYEILSGNMKSQVDIQHLLLMEDGLNKMHRGLNSRAILEYIILKLKHG